MKTKILFLVITGLILFSQVYGQGGRFEGHKDIEDTLTGISTDTQLLLTNVQTVDDTLSDVLTETKEIEYHLHHRSWVVGRSALMTGQDMAVEDTLGAFQVISGDNAFGDTLQILGNDDLPVIAGSIAYDPHEFFVCSVSHDTEYIMRIIWHTNSAEEGLAARQYSSTVFAADVTNPQQSAGSTKIIGSKKISVNNRLWVQIKNATDSAWADILLVGHDYDF